MPRRGTRPGPPTLLFGVYGAGETTPENIEALLEDFIEGAGNVSPRFLVPLDSRSTPESMLAVIDYATEKEYPYEVVYQKKPTTKVLKPYVEGAAEQHQVDEVIETFTTMLAEGDDARLLFLWDEDDKGEPNEADQRVLAAIFDAGVVCLDLTQGLDVLDLDSEPEPEPEPKKAPAKKAPAKSTAKAKEEPEPEPDPADNGGEEEPDFETVDGWPLRRIRKYALEVAAADRADDADDVPEDDEINEMSKDDLMDFLFPPAEGEEPEPDPEPEPEKPRSGRATRKAIEDEGGKPNAGAVRRAKKDAPAAEEPQEPADDAGEGEEPEEPSERLTEAMLVLFPDMGEDEAPSVAGALRDIFAELADVVIDRIAKRVEAEPETSAVRREIAPPRPPGKPRKDGEAPVRRRTARSR